MMSSTIILYIAVICLSSVITYFSWTQVRVIRLRQEMFDKRDEMFDKVFALDALDDPAYQDACRLLNRLALFVPNVSLPLMTYLISHQSETENVFPASKNPQVQQIVDDAFQWAAERLYRYVVRETASGWVVWFVFEIVMNAWFAPSTDTEEVFDKKAVHGCERVIRSESISRMVDPQHCAPA